MKPGQAVRSAAREVVTACTRRGAFATRILPGATAGLEPRDADLAREIALGVLRNLSRLDFVLASAARRPLGEMHADLLDVLRVALYQVIFLDRVPPHAAVAIAVDESREARGEGASKLANGLLRTLLRRGGLDAVLPPAEPALKRLAVEFSLPEWWVARMLDRYGRERVEAIAKVSNLPATIDLLVDTRARSVRSVLDELSAAEVVTEPIDALPAAILLPWETRPPVDLLRTGAVAVVDSGAQFVASLLDPPRGGRVLDAAASPGGKSLVLTALRPDLILISGEQSTSRLQILGRNLDAWHLPRRSVGADLFAPPFAAGSFDAVVADLPCSGTGTMRKNPEIRWQLLPAEFARQAERQLAMLRSAASLVRSGGTLLYSTCSLEPEENEQVIAAFLENEPSWEPVQIPLPGAFPSVATDQPVGQGVRLLPGRFNDGHTVFLLRRRA